MITNVRGSFNKLQGVVLFDPADPLGASIEATIDAGSIDTREPQRDGHLKSPDFLNVEAHPHITFKSTQVKQAGDGELAVVGDLTIRGVTKEVTLKVEGPSEATKDPWGGLRVGATATTKIKRKEFGLAWNQLLEAGGVAIGDDVTITLDVQLVKK
jgi:polyisoprenoid-binding protein YceI